MKAKLKNTLYFAASLAILAACSTNTENNKADLTSNAGEAKTLLKCDTESGWILEAKEYPNSIQLNHSSIINGQHVEHGITLQRSGKKDENFNDVFLRFGIEGKAMLSGGAGPQIEFGEGDDAKAIQLSEALRRLLVDRIDFVGKLNPDMEVEGAFVAINSQRNRPAWKALECKGAPQTFNGLKVADNTSAEAEDSTEITAVTNGKTLTITQGEESIILDARSFIQNLSTPDVNDMSLPTIVEEVPGTWFKGADVNQRTGKIAVAVRGFLYAETSYDMVFVLDSADLPSRTYVPFGGAGAEATLPHRDVSAITYDDAGIINITTRHMDGFRATIRYNPDLSLRSCVVEDVEYGERSSDADCPSL